MNEIHIIQRGLILEIRALDKQVADLLERQSFDWEKYELLLDFIEEEDLAKELIKRFKEQGKDQTKAALKVKQYYDENGHLD